MHFFCDQCGVELSTGHACPNCKRILCHKHYFGSAMGAYRRKDGLCATCATKEGNLLNGRTTNA